MITDSYSYNYSYVRSYSMYTLIQHNIIAYYNIMLYTYVRSYDCPGGSQSHPDSVYSQMYYRTTAFYHTANSPLRPSKSTTHQLANYTCTLPYCTFKQPNHHQYLCMQLHSYVAIYVHTYAVHRTFIDISTKSYIYCIMIYEILKNLVIICLSCCSPQSILSNICITTIILCKCITS